MKLLSVMWGSYTRMLKNSAKDLNIELTVFPLGDLDNGGANLTQILDSIRAADVVLLYQTSDMIWDKINKELQHLGKSVPVISLGPDPSFWIHSSVRPEIVAACQTYLLNSGDENIKNLLCYIKKEIFHEDIPVASPIEMPWEGIYHPDAPRTFSRLEDYLSWHPAKTIQSPWIGILFSRNSWVSGNIDIENKLIRQLENEKMHVIPVFSYGISNDQRGVKGISQCIDDFFTMNGKPRVDAIIKMVPALISTIQAGNTHKDSPTISGIEQLFRLNVPVFQPIVSSHKTVEQWHESLGLDMDIAWAVAMPEFEGVIEPIYIGASCAIPNGDKVREPVDDRCQKIVERVKKWIALKKKPVQDRRVSFILNNNPCMNAEANIGAAAHFDSLESLARILQKMKNAGYSVTPPTSGKELIETILKRKAISEFRWTTTYDIIAQGGALMQMDMDMYRPYFSSLPLLAQEKVTKIWGDPPGVGMVDNGKILITGLRLGNATIHVQPKRGCYGARCDGQVCKILHDPACPPPHQYLATYYWIDRVFGADVIVNVGSHGNLEFLPGKGVGMSEECFPDIAIGRLPCLYIYNADNPAEGTIAKRRSYATLVDHMQAVITRGGLYEELETLDNLLSQYEMTKQDSARVHALGHLIKEAILSANLDKDMHLNDDDPLEVIVTKAHESLSRIRNTQIPSGMHILGERPDKEKRIDFINSIIRFDSGDGSLRRVIAQILGFDLSGILAQQGAYCKEREMSYGALLEQIDAIAKEFIRATLEQKSFGYTAFFSGAVTPEVSEAIDNIRMRIVDLDQRIERSDEIGSLLHGAEGGYIPAGPSGLITRGNDAVLPTGRNFYTLDPYRVPTRAAWLVGNRLAEALIKRYYSENGKFPDSIAFYWTSSDLISTQGELFAEMLTLIGVEPVWLQNEKVKSFTVIPLEKLGRPRIDITVRTSGILCDNFSNCYELLDEAVQAVAALDEPEDRNYVRKHTRKTMVEVGTNFRDSTLRIFSTQRGTYMSGVNLAILASAWKNEQDLTNIFVAWNGFAYGKEITGKKAHEQFALNLSTVSATFGKVQSDEYDLLSCCCGFGTLGGMTAAARHYSGNKVKSYFGDTREPAHLEIRELADEIRRVVRTKLLSPKWIGGMKEHGYKGAADIMKRVTHVYGWEATTQEVDDWIFNDIADTFVNNDEMRSFFQSNNPYALEEIARRLLEAEQRGLWDADKVTLEKLRNNYLEIESWLEDSVGEGEFQGGNVDIFTQEDVPAWKESMGGLMAKLPEKYHPS